jgi:hypothetical protein
MPLIYRVHQLPCLSFIEYISFLRCLSFIESIQLPCLSFTESISFLTSHIYSPSTHLHLIYIVHQLPCLSFIESISFIASHLQSPSASCFLSIEPTSFLASHMKYPRVSFLGFHLLSFSPSSPLICKEYEVAFLPLFYREHQLPCLSSVESISFFVSL